MDKMGRVKCEPKVAEMLFELQVEAFIEGISDYEPNPADYGVSAEMASTIVGRVVLGEEPESLSN
jgi:hypothetical protein